MDIEIYKKYSKYVVHCKKDSFDVYVGRPSKFGNPFSHLENTQAKFKIAIRTEAINKFHEWILTQPELIVKVKKELKNKILSYFCSPFECHGLILAIIANEE